MRRTDRAFRTMHCVGVEELHRDRAASVGKGDLLEDLSERFGFVDRVVAAFFSAVGRPTEIVIGGRIVAGANRVFNIGVGPGLVQFVIEGGDDVLP